MLMGLESQPYVACWRARSNAFCVGCGELRSAILEDSLAIVGNQSLDRLCQRREGSLRIGGHGDIEFLEALKILIIALRIEVERADADQLGVGPREGSRSTRDRVAIGVNCAPEIVYPQPKDYVRIRYQRAATPSD